MFGINLRTVCRRRVCACVYMCVRLSYDRVYPIHGPLDGWVWRSGTPGVYRVVSGHGQRRETADGSHPVCCYRPCWFGSALGRGEATWKPNPPIRTVVGSKRKERKIFGYGRKQLFGSRVLGFACKIRKDNLAQIGLYRSRGTCARGPFQQSVFTEKNSTFLEGLNIIITIKVHSTHSNVYRTYNVAVNGMEERATVYTMCVTFIRSIHCFHKSDIIYIIWIWYIDLRCVFGRIIFES